MKQIFILACLLVIAPSVGLAQCRESDAQAFFARTTSVANYRNGNAIDESLREFSRLGISLVTPETAKALTKNGYQVYPSRCHLPRAIPNDSFFSELWGLHNTGQTGGVADVDLDLPQAWDITPGSKSVVVAVLDSGIDYNHPDLKSNMWKNPGEIAGNGIDDDGNGFKDDIYGIDTANGDSDPMDDHFHGTHIAGTIGARGANSLGVVGVNQLVGLMALKAGDSEGLSDNDIFAAIDYALMMKLNYGVNIRVINASFGYTGTCPAIWQHVIDTLAAADILFVTAAGNESLNNDQIADTPSTCANVLSVAAMDETGKLADFSNYGANKVHLAAPGVNILSTVPGGGYGFLNGTSMAAPHVAGVAALLLAAEPSLGFAQLKDRLLNTTKASPHLSGEVLSAGFINAYNALTNTISENLPTFPPPPQTLITAIQLDFKSIKAKKPKFVPVSATITNLKKGSTVNVVFTPPSKYKKLAPIVFPMGLVTNLSNGAGVYSTNAALKFPSKKKLATKAKSYKTPNAVKYTISVQILAPGASTADIVSAQGPTLTLKNK